MSNPTRLEIVHLLLEKRIKVTELSVLLSQSKSTTSRHLKQLNEVKAIEMEKEGRNVYVSLKKN